MMATLRLPLAFLAWFALLALASGRLLQNDKVHWKGIPNGAALKARARAPVIEDRSEKFRFLTEATEGEITPLLEFFNLN